METSWHADPAPSRSRDQCSIDVFDHSLDRESFSPFGRAGEIARRQHSFHPFARLSASAYEDALIVRRFRSQLIAQPVERTLHDDVAFPGLARFVKQAALIAIAPFATVSIGLWRENKLLRQESRKE